MQRQTGHMEDKKRTGLESQGTENAFSDGRDGKYGLLHEGINEPILIPSTIADLEGIRELVRKFRGRLLPFEKCPDFCLRIGGLEASFHKGQEELLEYCEALYLPQPVKMEIVGIVDDVPCLATGMQLLILVAEGGEVYAYEEDTLHKLATSFSEFLEIGVKSLGREVYHCGEYIEQVVH